MSNHAHRRPAPTLAPAPVPPQPSAPVPDEPPRPGYPHGAMDKCGYCGRHYYRGAIVPPGTVCPTCGPLTPSGRKRYPRKPKA